MVYNITDFVNNSDTFPKMFNVVNTASNGFWTGGLMLVIFLLLYITMSNFGSKVSLLTSSMITSFIAVLFWWAGWLAFPLIFIPLIILVITLLWSALGE